MHASDHTIIDTPWDEPFAVLSRSYSTIHVDRVAALDRHDTNARTQDRKVHVTKPDAVATSTSLDSNSTAPSDCVPVAAARNPSTMELWAQDPQDVNQFPSATRPKTATFRPRDWTVLSIPGPVIPVVQSNAVTPQSFHEDLSEGRRRVGEILVRCGVINASGTSQVETTSIAYDGSHRFRLIDTHVTSNMVSKVHTGEDDGVLIPALADWTSQWVYKLVIQPYLRGNFYFKYQRMPGDIPVSVSSRIRQMLSDLLNPVQVVVYALWFISTLTGNGVQDNAPFLSVPIFRYLHNNGTFIAEDFMFRTFVVCAMISDKTINDASLSTRAWSRLTRVPQVILHATERYTLSCLKWNTIMTPVEWQDTIIFLRSCIKMSSVFDPFAYDEASPSGVMVHCLDKLIGISCANETIPPPAAPPMMEIISPRPVRHFTHWDVFDATEWCPEDDPVVNQKPRTIGIAPGTDENRGRHQVGTTAKDLLDSILGSRKQAIIGQQSWWSLVYDLVT